MLHSFPLPLSSCLGCTPPLIGLPFLRFYAVASSLFLLFVFSIYFLSIATMSSAGYLLVHSLLSAFSAYLRRYFRFDLVSFRLSCDHGWIRSCRCGCCCCLHIKSRSGLYSVLSNIRTGPTDANAFRGHRLTTEKGYTYQKEIKGPRKVNTHAIIGK